MYKKKNIKWTNAINSNHKSKHHNLAYSTEALYTQNTGYTYRSLYVQHCEFAY